MKIWQKFLIIGGIACAINTAFAFNLDEARRQGKVVEQADGYLRANDPSVQNEVNRINNERQREYERIAQQEKIPVAAVAQMAAEKLMKKK
jgi:uncharacterized protein YdbL (DUF1318 family)